MTGSTAKESAPRAPLTRDRVLRTAMALADESGIEALTMRRLAQELGVEAMSLYYHVPNKDDIVTGILGMALQEVELPPSDLDWKEALRKSATSVHDVLERHPWASPLMLSPGRVSEARFNWMDAVLGRLREAGFSANLTHHAYHALDSHITGSTLWESGYANSLRNVSFSAEDFLKTLPEGAWPHLVEHVHTHIAGPDDIREFDFGLDLILDSLERILAQSSVKPRVSEPG